MADATIKNIYSILEKQDFHAPVAELISIQTRSPEKILISTILSARTKDSTTALASKKLFSRISKIQDLTNLSLKELENLIYPVGFYKTKARHLKKLPPALKNFNNKVPETIEELLQLPGVGRKTANLVLATAFNKPAIAVDVHVNRTFNRLGIIRTKTPEQTEQELKNLIPKNLWRAANKLFVPFGQAICTPVSPHCSKCPIERYCRKICVKTSR